MYSIMVIGNKLHSEKWTDLYSILEGAVSAKILEYTEYEISKYEEKDLINMTLYTDGIIYLGCHAKTKDKPYIKLSYTSSSQDIINEVQNFAKLLKDTYSKREEKKELEDVIEEDRKIVLTAKEFQELQGAVLVINGQEVCLNKQDLEEMRKLLELVKEFNYEIKSVICD